MTAAVLAAALLPSGAGPAAAFARHDRSGTLEDTQPTPTALWNLDRIDQAALPLDGTFSHAPSGVPIYVLGDGVRVSHAEFEGRARNGFSAFASAADCSGHGTRVAALAAGRTYGTAKKSPVIAVKVADCATVTSASVVAGIDWVRQNAKAPAVINLSVGPAGADQHVDDAVRNAVTAGLTVVMSAGDDGADSCTRSPARVAATVPGAIVVSATDRTDARPSDANQGACVSLFAPGADITSAGAASDTAVATAASGTSYAAPLVAGAAATILATQPAFTPLQVKQAILARATTGKVTNTTAANRLLHIPAQHQPATATSNGTLNTLFNTYGDQGGHWTGGDESLSVALPDGRTAWFFGDTMLGTVNPDGTRPPNQPMIHNSMVVQNGNSLVETRIGGTASAPRSFVGSATDDDPGSLGWWPGEARIAGDKMEIFYTHVGDGGTGEFAYETRARGIATISLPSLTVTSLTELPDYRHKHVSWGAAMVDGRDGHTYIYGTEHVGKTTFLKIARVASSSGLTGAWQFWTGASNGASQWSSDPAGAASVMSGVGTGFSLKYLNGRYTLVTFDLSQPFSNRMLAFFAAEPTGPFTDQTLLYQTPENGGQYSAYTYNARIHPQATPSGYDFTVSYNVNTMGGSSPDARLYRPRFIDVKLPAAAKGADLPAAPTNLAGAMDGTGKVSLTWTAPAGAGLTYQVYERAVTAGATTFTRTHTTSGAGLSLHPLEPGHYQYRVAARNASGEGPASLTVDAGIESAAPSAAPGSLRATAQADGTVKLAWTAVTGPGWIGYRVEKRDLTAGETAFTAATATLTGPSAAVESLTYEHRYAFRVTAYNGSGPGPASAVVEATVLKPRPPSPTDLTATANPDGTITLSWINPDPSLWVWVYPRNTTRGEQFGEPYELPVSSGNTFTASGLANGENYEFRVVTFNSAGESLPSNTVSATSAIALKPAPTGLTAKPNYDGTIGLTWNSSGDGVWYHLWSRNVTDNGAFTRGEWPITSGPAYTAGGLTPGKQYAYYVTALNTAGREGPASAIVTARSAVAVPANVKAATGVANDGKINLTWAGAGSGAWYHVYSKNLTTGAAEVKSLPISSGPGFTAAYLTNGHQYAFWVTTIGQGNIESARSARVTAST